MPLLAALPDLSWVIVAAVIVMIVCAIGLGVFLRFVKELRSNLAQELKREIVAQQEPTPITIQSPLEITDHAGIATKTELQTVKDELHGRLKRERAEINAEIKRVESATEKRSDGLAADLKKNTELTLTMSGEVKQINQNVHLILTSLSQPK